MVQGEGSVNEIKLILTRMEGKQDLTDQKVDMVTVILQKDVAAVKEDVKRLRDEVVHQKNNVNLKFVAIQKEVDEKVVDGEIWKEHISTHHELVHKVEDAANRIRELRFRVGLLIGGSTGAGVLLLAIIGFVGNWFSGGGLVHH